MTDLGEGMIVIGQLAQDWKKGDFSRGCRGCGTCGCFLAAAFGLGFVSIFVIGLILYRSTGANQ